MNLKYTLGHFYLPQDKHVHMLVDDPVQNIVAVVQLLQEIDKHHYADLFLMLAVIISVPGARPNPKSTR